MSEPAPVSLTDTREDILVTAENFVKRKFQAHDPSHDWHHVHRVRQLSLHLAASLSPSSDHDIDPLVLELGALFHDLCDSKYLPPAPAGTGSTTTSASAKTVLADFWAALEDASPPHLETLLPNPARRTIERIVDNVSWSKDNRRKAQRQEAQARGEDPRALNAGEEAEQIDWEDSCREFWCISDADRLDAIGSIGILRCAAFSAVKMRPLHVPPANPEGNSRPPAEQGEGYNGSCIAHFHEKLLLIKGDRLRTQAARLEAERRQTFMESFLNELDLEWLVGWQGEQMFRMKQDMADVESATKALHLAAAAESSVTSN
ncbi:hypothetical protein OC846_004524 [Tilletia horrida]|uniref:HD/PDEase domain-containing protein n=1 Tax=Tilletia horrida TaxID=155126 RepID=A0AAN6GNH8_9BASI|nr:hypothetical protein OC846_004524 [Tilletia horrida]KAK0548802.1 hypothetical protein OC845_003421 [Tilletia horrida]